MPRREALVLFVLSVVVGCTERRAWPTSADARADAGRTSRDGGPVSDTGSFDCDPIQTGIYVLGNVYDVGPADARRVLGAYDPGANVYTELADLRSCIEGWYVRSLAVSRDGIAYVLLANQTLAAYALETGQCEVHGLARSEDEGLYDLVTFVGTGAHASSPHEERLIIGFQPWSGGTEILLDLDRTTFHESVRGTLALGPNTLVSIAGTDDGRLFGTRASVAGDLVQHEVVSIDEDRHAMSVVATTPARHELWFRSAVALWDRRIYVLDAIAGDALPVTTVSEADPRAAAWSEPSLTLSAYEVQAVATTTCVGVVLF